MPARNKKYYRKISNSEPYCCTRPCRRDNQQHWTPYSKFNICNYCNYLNKRGWSSSAAHCNMCSFGSPKYEDYELSCSRPNSVTTETREYSSDSSSITEHTVTEAAVSTSNSEHASSSNSPSTVFTKVTPSPKSVQCTEALLKRNSIIRIINSYIKAGIEEGKRRAKRYIRKALSLGLRSGYLTPADEKGKVLQLASDLLHSSRADVEGRSRRRRARRGEERLPIDRRALRHGQDETHRKEQRKRAANRSDSSPRNSRGNSTPPPAKKRKATTQPKKKVKRREKIPAIRTRGRPRTRDGGKNSKEPSTVRKQRSKKDPKKDVKATTEKSNGRGNSSRSGERQGNRIEGKPDRRRETSAKKRNFKEDDQDATTRHLSKTRSRGKSASFQNSQGRGEEEVVENAREEEVRLDDADDPDNDLDSAAREEGGSVLDLLGRRSQDNDNDENNHNGGETIRGDYEREHRFQQDEEIHKGSTSFRNGIRLPDPVRSFAQNPAGVVRPNAIEGSKPAQRMREVTVTSGNSRTRTKRASNAIQVGRVPGSGCQATQETQAQERSIQERIPKASQVTRSSQETQQVWKPRGSE